MMKGSSSIFVGWRGLVLAVAVISVGLLEPAYCRTESTVLLLRQTPVNGGTITPAVGIHSVGLNTEIALTAVPKAGYQFVYWLGDVSDPTANNTTAYIDTPKIIIAVFERAGYEFLVTDEMANSAPGNRLMPGAADYAKLGGGGGGGRKKRKPPYYPPPQPPEPEDEEDDFPVPTPEPATVILLGLGVGGLRAFTRRRTKKRVS